LLQQIPNDGKARLLVVDGYGSHTLCPEVLRLFIERNIHCICMPSHTSQALQPLDVTCFAATKHFYRVDLSYVSARFGIKVANKYTVTNIFELAIEHGCNPENIRSGFQKCGLVPFEEAWPEKNKHLFHLAEELNSNDRKRKWDTVPVDELPWKDVVETLQSVRQEMSDLLSDSQSGALPATLLNKLGKTNLSCNQHAASTDKAFGQIFPMPAKEAEDAPKM
jgi:hypothetical protein